MGIPRVKIKIPTLWKYRPGRSVQTISPYPRKATESPLKGIKLSPEAAQKSALGFLKACAVMDKLYEARKRVEPTVPMTKSREQKIEKRKRVRLHMTVAREAREIQDIARRHATAVVTRLAEIAETSYNESAAIAAASVLLDRAYGKANQTNINANIDANGKPSDVSQKELDTRVEKALERIRSLTGGALEEDKGKDKPADVRIIDRDPPSSALN